VDNIVLIGFMGSGKSTLGAALATDLGREFCDMDTLIERLEEMTVPDLFEKKGESYFRKCESSILQDLSLVRNMVVACGGGTPCFGNNMDLIKKLGTSFYLNASIEYLYNRIESTSDRPLKGDFESMKDLLAQRDSMYAQADVILNVEDKSIEELIDSIKQNAYA
jgi:shikimate kinase